MMRPSVNDNTPRGMSLCSSSNYLNSLTLSRPGFEKLAQTGGRGADSSPLLTPLPCIRTKPNLVWANTII